MAKHPLNKRGRSSQPGYGLAVLEMLVDIYTHTDADKLNKKPAYSLQAHADRLREASFHFDKAAEISTLLSHLGWTDCTVHMQSEDYDDEVYYDLCFRVQKYFTNLEAVVAELVPVGVPQNSLWQLRWYAPDNLPSKDHTPTANEYLNELITD